jgi:hypothetical protein
MARTAFSWMMQALDPHPSELALIENAIGVSLMGKLRGHRDALAEVYRAKGGKNEITLKILGAVDKPWGKWDISGHVKKHYAADFNKIYHDWDMSPAEHGRVAQTLGKALLSKLEGQASNLTKIYKEMGGAQAEALKAFANVQGAWDKFTVERLLQTIAGAVD